jgi:formiminotetrahydrofolate cyclodeaminase
MLDLEQTLKELSSFVRRLTDDKEKNIQDIQAQRKEICEEIHKIRKSLNDHLDQLQDDSSRFGQQLVIHCSPVMTWLNEL